MLAEISYGADAFGFWAKNAAEVPRRRARALRSSVMLKGKKLIDALQAARRWSASSARGTTR